MKKIIFILLIILLAIISLFVGIKDISPIEIFNMADDKVLVMFASRVPRVISIILAGIGVSVSGLIMQQITQNKFVSPTTAGTLDASKMGILLSVLLIPQGNVFVKILFSFAVCFVASMVFLNIIKRIKYKSVIFIPLVGIMFGNILSAISTFFGYKYNIIQNMQSWMIGDFSSILRGRYEILYVSIIIVILTYVYANRFTVVAMGESMSVNLGVNYKKVVKIGFVMISLTMSITIITVGVIPFLGLIIPNIVSLMFGDNLKKILPYTAIFGAGFLLICDILGRIIIYPYEIPIGLMIGVIGGVIFLSLLLKHNR